VGGILTASCVVCGEPFLSLGQGRTCSYECRRENNLRRGRANHKRWLAEAPGARALAAAASARRNARKNGAMGDHTVSEWQALCERYDNACLCCDATDKPLTRDHIVPLALNGTNNIANLQLLCGTCNSAKGLKIVSYRKDGGVEGESGATERLTIAEAAALLGVHKNTVRNRIKNGSYRAEMVQTERGPTYLIERESLLNNLTTNTLSSAPQEVVSPQAMEFVQELLRPFVSELGEAREELGAERARRQMAEVRVADLQAELGALRSEREFPETVEDAPEGAEPRSAAEGTQEASQRPWWRRVFGG
jgi:excisionase family DNA binding protein